MIQTMQFLKQEFPDIEEVYFQILLQGIARLTHSKAPENTMSRFDQLIPIVEQEWHLYFKRREYYLRELLKIWPTVALFQIENQLSKEKSFDQCLDAYQQSHFGIFLANTKMFTSIYLDTRMEWEKCYESWIAGNVRIIHPVSGLGMELLRLGIRKILNEMVFQPEKYHSDSDEFRKMIKRHYQLMLTEQNS